MAGSLGDFASDCDLDDDRHIVGREREVPLVS